MDSQDKQYLKMTETPVWKLIISLGIPTTISMLITNIYNMADTYFVSQISVAASGATGIVFALMAILQAFGFMFGHGAGSHVSRQLGARHIEKAKVFTSTSALLALITGILIMVIGLLFLEPLLIFLGSTPTILVEAKVYAFYILISGPAMVLGCVLNNILRYEGKAAFAMVGLTLGGILNMFLDPIFIFTFDMGIAGAGLATALSQYISLVVLYSPFYKKKTATVISKDYISKDLNITQKIVVAGLPSLIRQGLNSVSTSILNIQASPFGDEAIAAMSVVSRCSGLLFSFALGIGQGFQPVSAFNYGAEKYKRVKQGTYFTMAFGVCVLGLLCGICYFNAESIIMLFRDEYEVVSIGTVALKYFCSVLFLLPVSSTGNMLFQSIGESKKALFLASVQSGLLFIPLILILPSYLGILGIQIAQPLSYVVSAIISFIMVNLFLKKIK